ncbi:MAG: hypothetical protein JSV63_03195 [Candidatus Aenigmatarchaeota archaeon]|nr:MAG: hypothetical protein JSV63_03195 [Candidatus Aenigmarchaeota archaeon]
MITMNCKYFIIMAALLAIVPSQASAYFGAAFEVTHEVQQVCPCGIISSDEIFVELINFGTKTDTYFISMELPVGWTGFIVPDLTMASGEKVTLDPLWITPSCGTEPGEYVVRLVAESAMSGKVFEKEVELNIIRCHGVSIAGENYLNTCQGSKLKEDFEITNTGMVSETFRLSASPEWVTVSPDTVSLDSWDSTTVSVIATPPAELAGIQEITVTAESTLSYATTEKNIRLDLDRCHLFSANILPEEDTICAGKSAEYQLHINNVGTEDDTYTIVTPNWAVADESRIKVGSQERGTVTVRATPPSSGKWLMKIYVSSVRSPALSVVTEGTVNTADCRSAAVYFSSPEENVCIGESTEFTVTVENTGNVITTYNVEASIMETVSKEKLVLGVGESQDVVISVTETPIEGRYPVNVMVSSGERAIDKDSAILIVHRCYDASLTVNPGKIQACKGDVIDYKIRVENTGEFEDDYMLTYPDGEDDFILGAKDSVLLERKIAVDMPAGENTLHFRLESAEGVSIEKGVRVNVNSEEVCRSVNLSIKDAGKEKKVQTVIGEGTAVEMILLNDGLRTDTYSLTVSGPLWAHLSTERVTLGPLEEESVYLYLSPTEETEEAEYRIAVIAASENAVSGVSVDVKVLEYLELEQEEAPVVVPPPAPGDGFTGMLAAEALPVELTLISALAFLTALLVGLRFFVFR